MSRSNGGEPRWLHERNLVRPPHVAADAVARVLRVPPESAGSRVDVFLSAQLRNTSRSRAKLIAENGAHRADGRSLRPSDRLRAEDRVVLWRDPVDDEIEDPQLTAIYEDEHLLVINKPANLAVHPTARHYHGTVMKVLERTRPGEFFALVHRLDRETSGILLIAKTPQADRAFKQILEAHVLSETQANWRKATPEVHKSYLAITWGVPPAGMIDAPLEPESDNPLRVKMCIAQPGTGLPARTLVEVLDQTAGYAVVRCTLLTGRQHQIRVHLASLGFPVVGDKLYGPDERMLARASDGELTAEDLLRLELPRHALHAERYSLPHALEPKTLDLRAPAPADLQGFWRDVSGRDLPERTEQ
ncbi:MAG TPA: RluA family pseudouridine synthase [Polyangiaceae bacterium]|nr:RluA family pseudouridine synthase [Polyangiaceae bacterium]